MTFAPCHETMHRHAHTPSLYTALHGAQSQRYSQFRDQGSLLIETAQQNSISILLGFEIIILSTK